MYKIFERVDYSADVFMQVIEAPAVAAACQPGQFIILMIHEEGERIPLTIADFDREAGTITIVVQAIGTSTRHLQTLGAGDSVSNFIGPLGQPSEIANVGKVICAGGGVGVAPIYPIARAIKEAGNKVISIVAARNQNLLVWEDKMREISDELIVTTDDGSRGLHGLVTEPLKELCAAGDVDLVVAIGPGVMMKFCARTTQEYGVKTMVSLNSIMVDGTGMCGGCRVVDGGVAKFACVDGPEFDGHQVDFDGLSDRLTTYRGFEEQARHAATECRLTLEAPLAKLSVKERLAIPRVHMPERDPEVRSRNFEEVNLGLDYEQAVREALRCIQCKHRPCVEGCPVGVSIPEFIAALATEDLPAAAKILQGDNALPAVCGRVCPQESQCEAKCVCGVKGDAVAIGYLERYVADWAMANAAELPRERIPPASGKRVAIVGGGPAGLTAAGELARQGHGVTIFEALHDTGGVLRYGIPEFRLPKNIIDSEVARLLDLGVVIECNVIIGKTMTLNQLSNEFDAVFIANGAGLPTMLNIPGENLKGVYSANELLTRVNLMEAGRNPDSSTPIIAGRRVAVIGGGNTAMDCVRTARRLGAERAMIVYRRSEAEMPARAEEIKHAKEEGVEFVMLTAPLEILGNEGRWSATLRCQRMELGPPDESGRRKPVPVPGSEYDIPVDVVVNAAGTGANPLLTATAPNLKLNKWGNIAVDDNGATSIPGAFAGGDIVRGGATVILAMGDGKQAAAAINGYLNGDV